MAKCYKTFYSYYLNKFGGNLEGDRRRVGEEDRRKSAIEERASVRRLIESVIPKIYVALMKLQDQRNVSLDTALLDWPPIILRCRPA